MCSTIKRTLLGFGGQFLDSSFNVNFIKDKYQNLSFFIGKFDWQTPFEVLYKRKNEPESSSFHLWVTEG
ncbi:hypothetical protein C0584_02370, partial [Candidatus Parcubacteria bacterium]